MQFKDYYDILGVPPSASADVIKSAYRKLARKYHPDVSKEKDAEDRFKEVNEAYDVLKDAEKRQHYDALRARGYRPGEEFRPPPDFGDVDVDFGGEGGLGDLFEALFGRGRGGFNGRAAPRGPTRPRPMTAKLAIDLERAFAGGPERVQVGERTIEVKIPAGIDPGRQIRLAKQAPGGGDLLLEIEYRPHPRFSVEGRDVSLRLPIAPWEAALGATVSVPTLAGAVELRIPAGSGGGRRMRLRGRGLPGQPPGDQYVVLEVVVPPAEDAERRALYERLRDAYPDFDPRGGR